MLMQWNPFREMAALQRDINRLFDTSPRRPNAFGETGFPLMDISETDAEIKIRALLPGMRREDVNITLHQNVLSISGEKKTNDVPENSRLLRQERVSGRFERTLRLNRPVDANKIRARLQDGVLTLSVPLKEEAKPKQITVSVT